MKKKQRLVLTDVSEETYGQLVKPAMPVTLRHDADGSLYVELGDAGFSRVHGDTESSNPQKAFICLALHAGRFEVTFSGRDQPDCAFAVKYDAEANAFYVYRNSGQSEDRIFPAKPYTLD